MREISDSRIRAMLDDCDLPSTSPNIEAVKDRLREIDAKQPTVVEIDLTEYESSIYLGALANFAEQLETAGCEGDSATAQYLHDDLQRMLPEEWR